MTASPPETTRRAGGRTLLFAGVVAAVLTAALWLYLARYDTVPASVDVAAGQTGTSAGGTWRLASLERADSIPNRSSADDPVTGATFVVASLDADLRTADPQASCSFQLAVGELRIAEDALVGAEPPSAVCARRGNGPVTVVFEVPARMVGDVRAVLVDTGTGDRPLRLAGTLG